MSRSVGAEQRHETLREVTPEVTSKALREATRRSRRRPVVPCLMAASLLLSPAIAAEGTGRREDAMRELQAAAQAGHEDASFALGVAYDLGRGVARDARLACRYYAEAGNRGHVSGAFNAAVMYDSGQCSPARRADLAAVWYGRAAAAGAGRAQFNLALLYTSGDGVPRNSLAATSWFRAAAASGVAAAVGRSGDAPRVGNGKGPLLPVVPTFPAPAQPLPRSETVTLVWTAPEQPDAIRFFVELYALKPSGPVQLVGRYVDVTAIRVPVPLDSTQFTWRVLTVGTDPPRYLIGPWQDFTTGSAGSEAQ